MHLLTRQDPPAGQALEGSPAQTSKSPLWSSPSPAEASSTIRAKFSDDKRTFGASTLIVRTLPSADLTSTVAVLGFLTIATMICRILPEKKPNNRPSIGGTSISNILPMSALQI